MEIWYDKATGECVKAALYIPGVGRIQVLDIQAWTARQVDLLRVEGVLVAYV